MTFAVDWALNIMQLVNTLPQHISVECSELVFGTGWSKVMRLNRRRVQLHDR